MLNEIEFTAAIFPSNCRRMWLHGWMLTWSHPFPLVMANLACWMAAATVLTRDAVVQQPSLALQMFDMSFTNLHLDATCISCSSRGHLYCLVCWIY